MPAPENCSVVPRREADEAASASTAIMHEGLMICATPLTISALSIPVSPRTPVPIYETLFSPSRPISFSGLSRGGAWQAHNRRFSGRAHPPLSKDCQAPPQAHYRIAQAKATSARRLFLQASVKNIAVVFKRRHMNGYIFTRRLAKLARTVFIEHADMGYIASAAHTNTVYFCFSMLSNDSIAKSVRLCI